MPNDMRQVTPTQIEEILCDTRGAKAVTITAKTEVRLKKAARDIFGQVFKLSRVNGMINWNYEGAVNRQREREGVEGDFVSHPRAWGVRMPRTPFVQHNDTLYLELKVQKSVDEPSYVNAAGETVNINLIREHLPASSSSSRQGVEKEIILRDYKMESITSITMDKTSYIIVR